jgi:hypothetical protein
MSKKIKKFVISCTKCSLTKLIKHKFYELLQSLSIFMKLRKNWTMNFIIKWYTDIYMIKLTSCFDYLDTCLSDQRTIFRWVKKLYFVQSRRDTWCTYSKLKVLQQENFVELSSWSSVFDTCKYDSNRALFDVDYQIWKKNFWKSSDFDVLRRASTKTSLLIFLAQLKALLLYQLTLFFSARSSRNIKIRTSSKSLHFRSDNQHQITLDLNHTYRYRMCFISLITL